MEAHGDLLVALDQSTQASKAILFDASGRGLRAAVLPHRQIYPAPGMVEHDPSEILANATAVIRTVLGEGATPTSRVACLCLTNQRETIVAWDSRSGRPLANALVWQDERGARLCDALAAEGRAPTIAAKTGLRLDPYFSASKLAWLARESEAVRAALGEGRLMAGTIDAWLVWNWTGRSVFATDYSNACRTMLFDIRRLAWDEELLGLFGLKGVLLPEPRPSDASFGSAHLPGMDGTIPIAGVMGDSHAALFGHRGWNRGDAKATYGTGSSIMWNIGPDPIEPGPGVVLSLAWGMGGQVSYVLEGNIHSTGYTLRWLRDNLGLFSSYEEAERLAREVKDNGGVYLVPAFGGLGAPHWESGIRALVTGLSHGSDRRHIARAGLESLAFQVKDLLDAMNIRSASPLSALHVDGGATKNELLMQFQADLLGIPVVAPSFEELSALGAAYMGGLARGVWPSLEAVAGLPAEARTYKPRMEGGEREGLVGAWRSAVRQAISRKI